MPRLPAIDLSRRLRATLGAPFAALRGAERRVWSNGDGRAYIEVGPVILARPDLARALEGELRSLEGVHAAHLNAALGRVIVDFDSDAQSVDVIGRAVRAYEHEHHSNGDLLRADPGHPHDPEALARTTLELTADGVGLLVGGVLRLVGAKRPHAEIDVAALLTLVEGVPQLRRAMQSRLGRQHTDLVLSLANALNNGLMQAWLGSTNDGLRRYLRLRELRGRRALFETLQRELPAEALAHHEPLKARRAPDAPTPLGPIERFSERVQGASLGGFGLGWIASGNMAHASAALFGGLPRPAWLGREAFAASLGHHAAERRLLVLNPDALRQLDRITTLLISAETLARLDAERFTPEALGALSAAAGHAGLEVWVEHDDPGWADARIVSSAMCMRALRARQRAHGAVCFIGAGEHPAFGAADCSLGLYETAGTLPWAADLIGAAGEGHLAWLVDAIAAARAASVQGVAVSTAELIASGIASLGGLRGRTTRRVIALSNSASLAAMLNGVRLARGVLPATGPADGRDDGTPWHALSVADALEQAASRRSGLSNHEAGERYVPPPSPPPAAARLASKVGEELDNPLTPVLGLGAGLAALTGSWMDAGLVGAVIGLNGLFGGWQRFRIEKAVARLHAQERRPVRAHRNGEVTPVDPDKLVVGDVIELESGDPVPADCRIVAAHGLEVDESSLTGESLPVRKHTRPVNAALITDRTSMLYAGTTLASGTARGLVVALDDDTEAQRTLHDAAPPKAGGVEARLRSLTTLSAPVAALGGALVGLAGLARGHGTRKVLGAGVSLAVAAIPEGLPLLATVAQLSAAGRLAERGVLVRNERALEALGRVQVLCADKTGTLTEGKIRLTQVSDGAHTVDLHALEDAHREVLSIALRASPDGNGRLPHMTDQALVNGAEQAEVNAGEWERLRELPFEPERGFHAVLGRSGRRTVLAVKGAPEVLLPRCSGWLSGGRRERLSAARREACLDACHEAAAKGLRVLAVAERRMPSDGSLRASDVDALVFRGWVAFADPVRASAKQAIADLRRAGVDIVMITGDHPSTAEAIARELGLAHTTPVTGDEIEAASSEALPGLVTGASIFARVTPSQKVRIVRCLQNAGKVVAMTGDGANDAPAIRLAQVGIAVGKDASEAARQAADLVVVDERIETLVQALLEGRALWSSVRDAVAVLVGGNLGEIAFTVLGTLGAGKPPLNARQLLLVNLLTDAAPAMAIALRPPRTKTPEQLLDEGPEASLHDALTRDILWRSTLTSAAAMAAWIPARMLGSSARASTVALVALVGAQLGQTLVLGGKSVVVWGAAGASLAAMLAGVQIPGISHALGCRPLGPVGLAQAGLAAGAATLGAALLPRLTDPVIERVTRWEPWRRLREAWPAGGWGIAPSWVR